MDPGPQLLPSKIMTDKGSQLMIDTLIKYANLVGIPHRSMPYSKEESGIVEYNKEVNWLIRNISFGNDVIKEWSRYLHI